VNRLRKIVHLQALRAIAAGVVIVDHSTEHLVRRGVLPDTLYPLGWSFGWVGVATFFTISGLIMIRSSANLFGEERGASRFMMRRIIRIVPLYWVTTLLFVAIGLARHRAPPVVDILKSLAFIPYTGAGETVMRPVAGHGWTLNYEMLFYVVFAGCLMLPRRIGVAALLAATPLLVLIGTIARGGAPYVDPVTPFQFWTDPVILMFGVGVVIGLIEMRATRWHRVSRPLLWTMAIIVAELIAFQTISHSAPIGLDWRAAFTVGAIVYVVLCTSGEGHRLQGLGRLFERLGDASYSTYLFHQIVLMILVTGWVHVPFSARVPWAFYGIAIVACNVVGLVSYRYVEGPLTAWLRARFEVRRRPPGEPPLPRSGA
jgi:peptidoglycan/LPS O-acetylase OafA/YrhL